MGAGGGLEWGLRFSLQAKSDRQSRTGKVGGGGEAWRGDFELGGEEGARAMHLASVVTHRPPIKS